jgi:RES domain-containing protein
MKKPVDLRAALNKLQGHPISGLYYRVLRPKYMHSPLSTEGARRTGARYNPKDRFGALYLAEDPEIGLAEAKLTLQGLPEFTRIKPATRIILCLEVKLSSVLDLTRESTIKALGTTLQELCGPWEVYDYQGKMKSKRLEC